MSGEVRLIVLGMPKPVHNLDDRLNQKPGSVMPHMAPRNHSGVVEGYCVCLPDNSIYWWPGGVRLFIRRYSTICP